MKVMVWYPGSAGRSDRWYPATVAKVTAHNVITDTEGRFSLRPNGEGALSRSGPGKWDPTTWLYPADHPRAQEALAENRARNRRRKREAALQSPAVLAWVENGTDESLQAAIDHLLTFRKAVSS